MCVPDRVCNPGVTLHNSCSAWQVRSVSSSASVGTHGLFLHTPRAPPGPQSLLCPAPALPGAPPSGLFPRSSSEGAPPRLCGRPAGRQRRGRAVCHRAAQSASCFPVVTDAFPCSSSGSCSLLTPTGPAAWRWPSRTSCGGLGAAGELWSHCKCFSGPCCYTAPRAGTAAGTPTGHAGIRAAAVCPPPSPARAPRWATPRESPGRAQALHTAPCHPGTGFGSALPPSWGRGGRNLPEQTSNMGGPLPPFVLLIWRPGDPVTLPVCTCSPALKACSGR